MTTPSPPRLTAEVERLKAERDAVREALSSLLDALAQQGAPTWERSLERACILAGRYCEPYTSLPDPNEARSDAVLALALDQEQIDRLTGLLAMIRDDFDSAIAAHDLSDPRHPSHGGQHTNGRCCAFGNVNPGSLRQMRWLRDEIDRQLSRTPREEVGR